ncbi:MAG: DUF411 domain-containing protein [Pseudomonas sp.]
MRTLLLAATLFSAAAQAAEPVMDVYRDPNCGCCKAWISHLQSNGIQVNDHVESDMSSLKQRLGVPPRLASCHTGVINGQFVEGHVPAADVLKLGAQPDLLGLAVPGMPAGSPGMEMGSRKDAYQVIGLERDGDERVVTHYPN